MGQGGVFERVMSELPEKELNEYLKKWRTVPQVQKMFGLSYTEVYHYLTWGVRAKFMIVDEVKLSSNEELGIKKRGKMKIYKMIE